jgi:DNA-binding transcriptional ArsR family regulator
MFMQLHEFINLLDAKGLKPRQLANGQWLAHCPAHDDAKPSLSVTESDGRILLHCFANCTVDAICAALGITTKDLRTDQELEQRVTFEVRDPNGALVALHERIERNGKKTFVWRHPDGRKAQGDLKVADLPLYGVHKLQSADFVVIVEGEKCAEALWSVGIPAVATYGATCDPADEPLRQVIERAPTVYLWSDNDDAGRKHMERLGKRLLALGATDVRWVEWHDAPEKGDAADAVAQRVDLHALLEAAKPFEPPEETPQNGATPPTSSQPTQCPFCQLSDAELFDLARPVLDAENPLQAAVERVSQTFGVVGENDNLQLLLLALTTRIFPQPVNVLVVGGTGQGKSFLTDAACATLPPCCHRRIVGASARALLFHPLAKGTVLQWLELPELGGDTIAATILRSILWQAPQETATDYLFVEWTPKGARRRSVQMPRQVALITTKVDLPKDDQLLSRFLVMEVKESPDKRRAVLSALAASFNGVQSSPTDDALEPVRAFAEWLGRVQARVTIPYAHALADLFAELPASECDYRDFATLLKLIAACALWNLAKRQHAFDGDRLQVTANLADYATVYRLLLPVWGKPRSAALSETERRVAEALKESDHPATAEELAKVVGITDKSVRRALKDLAEKGLAERGEKRGRAYEWRLVSDLDALTVTLPTPEAVAAAWQPDPDPTRSDNLSPEADPNEPTEPPSDLPEVTICHLSPAVTDIADIHGHDAMSAKNPINTSTFDFTDTRTQDTLQMDDTDAKVTVRKIIGHFEAAPMDAERQENRVRDVCDAKNPSGTSTFCGHSPMSANVRDVRDDRHDRDLPNPEGDLEVKVTCPKCGAWKRIPPDAFLLTDPRCPVCGEAMRPEPEGDPPEGGAPTPADPPPADPDPLTVTDLETGEPLVVGTDAWLEATFSTACPDCGTTLTDGTCPTCGYPDDPPQWRIGRLVMAIAQALRSRHPQCRRTPCEACRQVVARMNRAVVANDWQGLIALWREVTADAL